MYRRVLRQYTPVRVTVRVHSCRKTYISLATSRIILGVWHDTAGPFLFLFSTSTLMIIPAPAPPAPPPWPLPRLRLQIDDLEHEGASVFLDNVNPKQAMTTAVRASYRWLYSEDNLPPKSVPTHELELSTTCVPLANCVLVHQQSILYPIHPFLSPHPLAINHITAVLPPALNSLRPYLDPPALLSTPCC